MEAYFPFGRGVGCCLGTDYKVTSEVDCEYSADEERQKSMRAVSVSEITKHIKEMCIEANYFLASDMDEAMKQAAQSERSELGQQILCQLQENLKIAGEDMIPICQDTGMAVVFVEL